jgi:hypothetical protein
MALTCLLVAGRIFLILTLCAYRERKPTMPPAMDLTFKSVSCKS